MGKTFIIRQMAGKLIVVEGASGSGKSMLLSELAKNSTVMRGIASQDSLENRNLEPKARSIIGLMPLDFKSTLEMRSNVRKDLLQRAVEVARIQYKKAVDLKNDGRDVFLNRSFVSLLALLRIAQQIGELRMDDDIVNSSLGFTSRINRLMREVRFESETDGFILMEHPYRGPVREREGMVSFEQTESRLIGLLVRNFSQDSGIPLLTLDANTMPLPSEIELVRQKFGQSN